MDQLALGLVFFVVLVYGQLINQDRPGSSLTQFGWEYGNIATSLATSGSFADAMGPGGGPTAWMPPVLCWIYAFAFVVCGPRSHEAVLFLVTLKSLCLAACFVLFLGLAEQRWGRPGVAGGVALTWFWVTLEDYRVCGEFDDSWFVTCLSLLCLWALLRLQQGEWSWKIALLSLLLPIACPTLTLGYVVCAALLGWKARRHGRPFRRFVWVLALGLCSALAWGVRHQLVMGRFYPVKSNLWFDLVEANLWDDDGVLTDSIFIAYHPVGAGLVQERYNALGEVQFLDEARTEATAISTPEWLRRCQNRLANATLRMKAEMDFQEARGLSGEDLRVLEQHVWLRRVQGVPCWLFLYHPEREFREALLEMPLRDKKAVLRSRQAAIGEHHGRYSSWPSLCWRYYFTLIPALAGLVVLARGSGEGRTALLLYGCYLLPYVLVQHYCRYQVSVTWLQAFLLLQALRPRPPVSESS